MYPEGSHVMFRTHRGVRGQWKWARGRVINIYPDRREIMLKDGTNIVETVSLSRIRYDDENNERLARKKKKEVPPQVQQEVHDLLSSMVAKKRQRKLSLKNIVKDHIEDRRRSETHERTHLEMAVDAKCLDAKKQRTVSVSSQRPRSRKPRSVKTYNFG